LLDPTTNIDVGVEDLDFNSPVAWQIHRDIRADSEARGGNHLVDHLGALIGMAATMTAYGRAL
jgi:hypothetical protein